ncbi:chromosome transmission fidelity protein 18 homolog isoform X1 [Neocloeon triangulifer]|nr:chromosome transmission fidelity protein 18 homolog isoform X1 [Neocloeon triangulifer]XP_059476401.1 chromosome transmission fidelity protein 18 homolog isoform X1 [Neocloeon triangulifer]XP_059476408.1 chromosome transmission fidelity protein 18 homolog isoform X1 [Neocloeon triangulifer]XP_059476416.1 chromosome transmission fidelity protein 18 homolog isoform X1 [Neocloeon triangulifer]
MDGYPDPDEEFDLIYAEEMEIMREREEEERQLMEDDFDTGAPKRAKKSLSFTGKQSKPIQEEEADNLLNSSLTGVEDTQSSRRVPDVLENSRMDVINEELNRVGSSRKRKADELFGDIEDIEREEYYDIISDDVRGKEKEKNDELEEDLRLIARIREERQKILAENNLLPNERKFEASNGLGSEFITNRIPRYPFITMRNHNSDKYYLRLKSEDYLATEIAGVKAKSTNLLPTSLGDTWAEAQSLLKKMQFVPSTQQEEDELLDMMEVSRNKPVISEKLWVEKYQPHSYRELLSDEGTNKTVLKWLKMWDHVVFNKKLPSKDNRPFVKKPEGKFSGGKNPFRTLDEEYDSHGRPMQKIVLLCGPPGLGKTTLAHILAKHAGYNPVEVNASDDSSPDAFRLVLEAATQMRSVIGDNPKPNCLVLDEIDGTPLPAIEVLLKFITDKDISKGKKKKGAKAQILKRPIICICNDLYKPALRQLKQQALIINFPPTAAPRLAQRLLDVSKQEHLKTDLGTLLLLCDKTGNDIRSCLSFLHFFKTKNKEVRLMDVQGASVGQKDTQNGLFAVWHEMFQIVKPKNSRNSGSQRSRMYRILKIVQNFGEYEFLSQGVYENYLHMKMKETGLRSIIYGSAWFCYFDFFNTLIKQQQNYAVMCYLPYCFITWHLLYAGLAWPKINFPSKHIEVKNKSVQNVATLASLMKGMEPSIRSGIKGIELMCDTLPLMLHIILPNLKAVNAQLLSADEKKELQRVVDIFIGYSLSFIQERTANGEMLYRLEPNVPELVQFSDVPKAPEMIYAVKQLVGHEVDSEKLRRISLASGTLHAQETPTPTRVGKSQAKQAVEPSLPNHLQTLSPQILKKGPLKPGLKNWLTITKAAPTASQQEAAAIEALRVGLTDISYCYKEGYSNAVRKTIKISELL